MVRDHREWREASENQETAEAKSCGGRMAAKQQPPKLTDKAVNISSKLVLGQALKAEPS